MVDNYLFVRRTIISIRALWNGTIYIPMITRKLTKRLLQHLIAISDIATKATVQFATELRFDKSDLPVHMYLELPQHIPVATKKVVAALLELLLEIHCDDLDLEQLVTDLNQLKAEEETRHNDFATLIDAHTGVTNRTFDKLLGVAGVRLEDFSESIDYANSCITITCAKKDFESLTKVFAANPSVLVNETRNETSGSATFLYDNDFPDNNDF